MIPLIITGLGITGVLGLKFGAPLLHERTQVQTSDAVNLKGVIKIGADNFIGYFPLCSPFQRSTMRAEGYDQQCSDDKGDYAKRMEQLSRGEIQFAVATIDSYTLNARKASYPGLIVSVLDESRGADAIVSCSGKVRNVEDLKKGGIKIALTPGSPSEHLVKANAAHFDIPQLRSSDKSWRIETKGSAEAAKKCADGVVDVAVVWEPDVTKLLQSNSQTMKILGTENTSGLIVDVLIVRREFARDNPEAVKTLMRTYFKTLFFYRNNPDTAAAHAAKYADIVPAMIESAMKGVAWANLQENWILWFGGAEPGHVAQHGLIDAIERTTRILIENGDFTSNPFTRQDPSTIIQSSFVRELYESGLGLGEKIDPKAGDTLVREFEELTDQGWARLREVGSLRVRPVSFQSGADDLSVDAKGNIDRIVEVIKSYPNFRILIEGHTSDRGDSAVNLELSKDRAEAVARYIMVTYGVKQNRVRAVGYGGTMPPQRNTGETDREFRDRLSRVVVKLMTEAY